MASHSMSRPTPILLKDLHTGPGTHAVALDETSSSQASDRKAQLDPNETGTSPNQSISALRTGILIFIFCFAQFLE